MKIRHLARLFAGLILSFALVGSGCDCQDVGGLGSTRHLVASPESLSYDAQEGEEQTKNVKVTAKVGIVGIEEIKLITGKSNFTIVQESLPTLPMNLEEGDSFVLKIKYKAPAGIPSSGLLRIVSDSTIPAEGKLDIPLLTQLNNQRLTLTPNPANFGGLEEGQEKEIEVVGKNEGRAVLNIEKIEKDASTSPAFTFPDGLPTTPLEVKPGESFKFKIKFIPTQRKPDLGAILFTCKGGCAPEDPNPNNRKDPYTLPLSGTIAVPSIEVTPQQIDFGFVASGTTVSKTFKIKNNGGAELNISQITFKPGSSGAFIMPTLENIDIAPGASKQVAVQYRPSIVIENKGAVVIESNDPSRKSVEVQLNGKVSAPKIQVTPTKLAFGKAPVKKILCVTIANVGDQPLEVSPAQIVAGSSPEFTLEKAPAKLTLQPNGNDKLCVVYQPVDAVDDTGKLRIKSNDPASSIVDVTLTGNGLAPKICDLIAQPTQTSFGLCALGKSITKKVKFYNTGSSDCIVNRIAVSTDKGGFPPYIGPDVFTLSNFPTQCPGGTCNPPMTVKAGNDFTVDVTFLPTMERPTLGAPGFNGLVSVNTNATPSIRQAKLHGIGLPGCVSIVPDTIDFGLITINCASRNESILVYNTCSTEITVNKIRFKNNAANGFQFTKAPNTPFKLASGKTATIEVKYRATTAKQQNAVVEVEHSFTQLSPLTSALSAKGTTSADQTDTFKQANNEKADILFVIDNSGSMSDEQSSLRSNLKVFVQWAQTLKADFHIGVTTTEIDPKATPGKLRGSPPFITTSTPNPTTVFSNNANVGTGGLGVEAGLEAARQAFTPPLSTTGANKGFLRKDATLTIIAVSDEPDQSSEATGFYINFFKNLKGGARSDRFRLHAVIGVDPSNKNIKNCKTGSGGSFDGGSSSGRYADVANKTNGLVESICNTNWSSVFRKVGTLTFSLRKRFFLSRAADPKTIVVKVNGVVQNTGANTWTYNATTNSIDFASSPQAGTTIEVKYKAICF
ncbi:MAG: hypothetical protein CL920_39095 [Deltaproteobacteria bacterium]|nr:hypothetical protein [Deltaproteobacteria bacterium]|tara:strand:- start:1668 stop:4706 length:3039 start_codon:yes stop_codon:yes gene_type:complete